jgi:hypothetical protein
LPVQRGPDLAGTVDAVVVGVDAGDELFQFGVADLACRRLALFELVVRAGIDAAAVGGEGGADRLDAAEADPVLVDEGYERVCGRSSSAAKKDAAAFKISFARRSSAFSRSNALIRVASSVLIPGRAPASISAWRTQFRSVCAVPIPNFAAIDLIAASRDGYWSTVDRTRRTARSRRSAGYGLVRDITT